METNDFKSALAEVQRLQLEYDLRPSKALAARLEAAKIHAARVQQGPEPPRAVMMPPTAHKARAIEIEREIRATLNR